jgi:hypothetical protein
MDAVAAGRLLLWLDLSIFITRQLQHNHHVYILHIPCSANSSINRLEDQNTHISYHKKILLENNVSL